MNNLMASAKKFFKNKNVVTVIGVVIILVLLYIGYSTQINNAVEPVQVPVATQTIQPRTEITDDMVQLIDMPNISLSDNVIRSTSLIVGKYSNVNSVIPEGSMFYSALLTTAEELPDSSFVKVAKDEVPYNFPVTMDSTYGNSIYPGNLIDIYMKAENVDGQIMVGKLVENIEVLAVKDSSGKHVFENTSEERTPSFLIFGVKDEINILLRKASYMTNFSVELFPVPHGGQVDIDDDTETQVSTQYLKDFINANTVLIPEEQPAQDQNTNKDDNKNETSNNTNNNQNNNTGTNNQ